MNRLPFVGERFKTISDIWLDAYPPITEGKTGTIIAVESGIPDEMGLFDRVPQCRITIRFDEIIPQLQGEFNNCFTWYPECGPSSHGSVLSEFWSNCKTMIDN